MSNFGESINLRCVTPEDEELVLRVYSSTRAEELERVPWSEEQKLVFLQMQSKAQHDHYREVYPQAEYLLIIRGDRPIGRLYKAEKDSEIRVLDLTILPEERNSGIGTYLIRNLIAEGEQLNKAVTIHVESFNRSLGLFQRLGFKKVQENGIYFLMERPANAYATEPE
jgi:ribosomal protein S18 acetylase RimI-like enzyme